MAELVVCSSSNPLDWKRKLECRQQLHQQKNMCCILGWSGLVAVVPLSQHSLNRNQRHGPALLAAGTDVVSSCKRLQWLPYRSLRSNRNDVYTRANGKSSKHRIDGCIYILVQAVYKSNWTVFVKCTEGLYASHSRVMST